MFTVKATYRGEIRKFSFPEHTSFPSFDELYHQLYRVFPISHNYFLSKLLFSSDCSKPSRILIGREVHSANEYLQCISPFQGLSWHNALLRFSVFDETPHKIPSVVASDQAQSSWNTVPWGIPESLHSHQPLFQLSSGNLGAQPQQIIHPPPISMFHIPPPPVIYSSSPRVSSQPAMDVDPAPAPAPTNRSNGDYISAPPPLSMQQAPQLKQDTHKPSFCCGVADGKAEMEALMSKFKVDLDHIITTAFDSSQATPQRSIIASLPKPVSPVQVGSHPLPPLAPMPSSNNPFSPAPSETAFSFCLYKFCTACLTIFQGPWYSCEKCNIIACPGCYSRGFSSFCVVGPHVMIRETCDACPKSDTTQKQLLRSQPFSAPSMWPALPVPQTQRSEPPRAQFDPTGTVFTDRMRPYYPYGTPTPVMPFIPPMPVQTPVQDIPELPMTPQPVPVPPVVSSTHANPARPVQGESYDTVEQPPAPASPVIHHGVVCDVCEKTMEGIRHKCLDCPDYDLCTSCINLGYAERHNPFHEFLDLKEPGRVIVHTVFTGNGEREATPVNVARVSATPAPQSNIGVQGESVIHSANCDLCDTRIRGDRYKCLNCPDFDTCSSCFSITREQHPHHTFVKISKPSDYIKCRESPPPMMHSATCNGCGKGIIGIRYKCMHPECPDFDFCEGCEAHPIPMHPENHPFLKMRAPDTVIPTVYRVGQITMIEPEAARGRSRSPRTVSPFHRSHSRSVSFGRGYMRNPSMLSSDSGRVGLPSQVVDGRSPFYVFHARSPSRSRSPVYMPSTICHSPSRSRSPVRVVPGRPVAYGSHPVPFEPSYRDSWGQWRPPTVNRGASPRPLPVPNLVHPTSSVRCSRPRSHSPVQRYNRTRSISRSPDYQSPSHSRAESEASVDDACMSYRVPADYFHTHIVPTRYHSRSPRHTQQRSLSPRPSTPEWRLISDTSVPVIAPRTAVKPLGLKSSASSIAGSVSSAQTDTSRAHSKLPPLALDPSWPRTSQELKHLMQETALLEDLPETMATQHSASRDSTTSVVSTKGTQTVTESPLNGEALLNRPPGSSSSLGKKEIDAISINHPLATLFDGIRSLSVSSSLARSVSSIGSDNQDRVVVDGRTSNAPLLAEFLEDVTVPEGQNFPPGAEFVKCWRFLNSSERDWPENTELIFVAGESLARDQSKSQSVKVGAVKAGTEVDLWTGELKAPDRPGKYVGYWRLSTGSGSLFGDVIWIDITVTELSQQTNASNESLSSSSIIIMPAPAEAQSSVRSVETGSDKHEAPSRTASSSVIASSQLSSHDAASDDGSDGSSISLISVPGSEDEDERAAWEESRTHVGVDRSRAGMEYVLLYDDNSDEEKEDEEEE